MTPLVMLYLTIDWHAVILDRLADELSRLNIEVKTFRYTDIQSGSLPQQRPSLIVTAGAGAAGQIRSGYPDVTLLHVSHGLISKNQPNQHYQHVDYVCVASSYAAFRLSQLGHRPKQGFLATGLIQTDGLFRSEITGIRVPGCTTNIVYAPTWNPSLSSADMLGQHLIEYLRGDQENIGIVIKPHPFIAVKQPETLRRWQILANERPNVIYLDADSDLIPALKGGDLLVSDASSAIFHFLVLDRPIVLLDNPMRFHDPSAYDPSGIEWRWREIARCVDTGSALSEAVCAELAEPDLRRPMRQAKRDLLFGSLTDGRATERVANAVSAIISGELKTSDLK